MFEPFVPVTRIDSCSEDEFLSDDEMAQMQAKAHDPQIGESVKLHAAEDMAPPQAVHHQSQNRLTKRLRRDHLCSKVREVPKVLRGFRKPVEPGPEVMNCLSEATMAFASGESDRAEELTLKALQMNPEVFQAHNLLSEIHAARGDMVKSISVAWNGAHTRPRDVRMWRQVASLILGQDNTDREECLRDALYCYSRIIAVDRCNIEARYQRAALNKELGYRKKAVVEYEYLLTYLLPHNTTVLRHLAHTCIEMNDAERALTQYEYAMNDEHQSSMNALPSFNWSDINVLAELYIARGKHDAGLVQIKRLSRRLLGRSKEAFWDDDTDDDREWDVRDIPRRTENKGFKTEAYGQETYGQGLPLDIRVKLGVLRLFCGKDSYSEALVSDPNMLATWELTIFHGSHTFPGSNQEEISQKVRSRLIQTSFTKSQRLFARKGASLTLFGSLRPFSGSVIAKTYVY